MDFNQVFNTTLPNEALFFEFEAQYAPYQKYCYDVLKHTDLVIRTLAKTETLTDMGQGQPDKYLRAFEIKLTVVPDSATARRPEAEWASEIVVRPISTTHCVCGMADSCWNEREAVRAILEPVCSTMEHWDNSHEISIKKNAILDVLTHFLVQFNNKQIPLMMQPIWKTKGQSPELSENAFDFFVWSDFALGEMIVDLAKREGGTGVNRYMRSAARMARCLFDIVASGKANVSAIYTGMAFHLQTDKEFAVNGAVTHQYLPSGNLLSPRVRLDVLPKIILDGGHKKLSPERRFDATIYFTTEHLFHDLKHGQEP